MEKIDLYEIAIDKPFAQVKKIFLDTRQWEKWWGGAVKKASWRVGGHIVWETGAESTITVFHSANDTLAVAIEGTFTTAKFILQQRRSNQNQTIFSLKESAQNGAGFSDGGAAHRAQLEQIITRFGALCESTANGKKKFLFF